MKAFKITGHFEMGHNKKQPFTKEFAAESEDGAREQTLSDIGSRHGVNRRQIHVEAVSEIAEDDITDLRVRHILARGA